MAHPLTAPAFPALSPDAATHDAERRQWLLATAAMGCAATAAVALPLVSSFASTARNIDATTYGLEGDIAYQFA